MDLAKVTAALRLFMRRERTRFEVLAYTATQALEVGALLLTAEHYRRVGCAVRPENLRNGLLRTKLTARGNPWNFSWFRIDRDGDSFELHGNLSVKSATALDQGAYVVDVGVALPDRVRNLEKAKASGASISVENSDLLTFVEAKKLVIYPMLLAQFVGIVHEIKPVYLQPGGGATASGPHPFPALVSIGPPGATSASIVSGFEPRGFHLNVVPTFDVQISTMGPRLNRSVAVQVRAIVSPRQQFYAGSPRDHARRRMMVFAVRASLARRFAGAGLPRPGGAPEERDRRLLGDASRSGIRTSP